MSFLLLQSLRTGKAVILAGNEFREIGDWQKAIFQRAIEQVTVNKVLAQCHLKHH